MSALWPLDVAIDGAIQGDATLAAKLRGEKLYQLAAPETDDALPYIVCTMSIESSIKLFGSKGHDNIRTLAVWSNDTSKAELADLVDDLERLLDGTQLDVAGHSFCTGEFSVVAITLDPSGKYAQAVCRYEALTFKGGPLPVAPTQEAIDALTLALETAEAGLAAALAALSMPDPDTPAQQAIDDLTTALDGVDTAIATAIANLTPP